LTQSLLFTDSSQKLDKTLPAIKKANDALTESLESMDKLNDFLSSVSDFLKGVDQAIDIAKTLTI
jgi:hypothetical protein